LAKKFCGGKKSCYIIGMNKSSVKTAGRSAKSARRSGKKATKVVRTSAKKPAQALRRASGGSTTRALRNRSAQKSAPSIIRTTSPPMQPAAIELPAKSHKYNVGEMVYYNSPSFGRVAATGSYTVVKQLPSEGDDYQYRIKSSGEAFERVAKESQLDRA
jgi:hypothetical protein